MELQTAREKQLDAYITKSSAQDDQKERIVLQGQPRHLQVYRIPIKYLIYNIRNGRFAAELLDKESQLKRKLDPNSTQDAKTIQKLLLDLNPTETKALKADLQRNGQLDPGVITADGAVVNANRRMAILSELFDETHDPKFEYLRVARLPKDVDERDLWRIEAGLQFAKEFRLDYSPINELLKLKEGRSSGLSPSDISQTLLGRFSAAKVEEKLKILKLIESYLAFIAKPGQYHIVGDERDVEKFNSLQANVVAPLERKGKSPTEILAIVTFAFSLIHKTDLPHWDIRRLGKIAMHASAEKELLRNFNVGAPAKMAKDRLEENFATAREIIEAQEQQDRPERLLNKALAAVRSVRSEDPKISSSVVKSLLREMKSELMRLLKAAGV